MNDLNTNGVAAILKKANLDYIPEAHTYLKIIDEILDATRTTLSEHSFENSILHEEEILPLQIGEYKIKTHKDYLKNWIIDKKIDYTLEAVWDIREQCIKALN